jgi:segregation and condensation protein A
LEYQVDLDVFNGPMDLLLYLISKEEVDIHEVKIARIVDQYMAYLEKMKELNVDLSSDFVVMASTLILIKSKSLLPTEEIDLEEEMDQQDELIQHLLEYKKFKVLSRGLKDKNEFKASLYPRPTFSGGPSEEDDTDFDDVNLWDIIRAFARIVKETGLDRSFDVIHSEKPLSAYIAVILDVLAPRKRLPFRELFQGEKTRSEAISLFVGLLELARRHVITVVQSEDRGELDVSLEVEAEELEKVKEDGIYKIDLLGREEEESEEETEDRPITLQERFERSAAPIKPATPVDEAVEAVDAADEPVDESADAVDESAEASEADAVPAPPAAYSPNHAPPPPPLKEEGFASADGG